MKDNSTLLISALGLGGDSWVFKAGACLSSINRIWEVGIYQ